MARRNHSKIALVDDSASVAGVPDVTEAMMKGVCPLCAVLREFQNAIVERMDPGSSGPLCNFHCWSLAKSAPAMVALSVYSNMLKWEPRPSLACAVCHEIHREEQKQIVQFVSDLRKSRFAEWMTKFGTLCLGHTERLEECVPRELHSTLRGIRERNNAELQEQLQQYAEAIESGDRSGGGVLGKAAAFLAGFRGFSR